MIDLLMASFILFVSSSMFYLFSKRGIIDGFIFKKIPDNSYYDERPEDFMYGKEAIFQGIGYIAAGCLGGIPTILTLIDKDFIDIFKKLEITTLSVLIIIVLTLLFLTIGIVMIWRFIRDGFIKQKIIGVGGNQKYIYGNHAKIIGILGIASSSMLIYTAFIYVEFLIKIW